MPIVIDPPVSPPLPLPSDDGANLWEVFYRDFGYLRDFDSANDFALRKACEAWCEPLQRAYDLARERDDQPAPFAVIFDPDQCPAWLLPYAVRYVGVEITPEMTEAQIRNEYRTPSGLARGRAPAIKTAIRRTLASPDSRVILRTHTPELGHHYIRTLLSETPDPARTARVARAAVPAWEALDYAAIDGVSYAEMEAGWDTYADEEAAFSTYADAEDVLPDELPEP
jgi:hypothetical protein